MKKLITILMFAGCLQLSVISPAHAVVLPDPSETFDGLPVALQYDEFVSYSTRLLTQFGYAGFSGPAGVGGLDVVLLTNAGGIDNDPVAGGFVFEDPAPSSVGGSNPSFSGTWGKGDRANGPVLVDDLLAYLHNQFGPNNHIPVFTFDLAEPGAAATRDLEMLANFVVFDPDTNTEIASWSLDGINNGTFDPAAFFTVLGEISVTGTSTTTYTADNTGSGKYDFLVYAPTMDLSLYDGLGYEFHIFSSMRNLDGSKEEAFISGAFTTKVPPPAAPEPATLITAGLGFLSLMGLRFRKKS